MPIFWLRTQVQCYVLCRLSCPIDIICTIIYISFVNTIPFSMDVRDELYLQFIYENPCDGRRQWWNKLLGILVFTSNLTIWQVLWNWWTRRWMTFRKQWQSLSNTLVILSYLDWRPAKLVDILHIAIWFRSQAGCQR